MITINENRITDAEAILNGMYQRPADKKVVKKDKGLFEKTEMVNKVVITEDNKQLLLG